MKEEAASVRWGLFAGGGGKRREEGEWRRRWMVGGMTRQE